jgi:hypothetical protein
MTGGDAQKRESWTVGGYPVLFPVAKRVDADPQRLGKLRLGEADEPAKRRHVSRL